MFFANSRKENSFGGSQAEKATFQNELPKDKKNRGFYGTTLTYQAKPVSHNQIITTYRDNHHRLSQSKSIR